MTQIYLPHTQLQAEKPDKHTRGCLVFIRRKKCQPLLYLGGDRPREGREREVEKQGEKQRRREGQMEEGRPQRQRETQSAHRYAQQGGKSSLAQVHKLPPHT